MSLTLSGRVRPSSASVGCGDVQAGEKAGSRGRPGRVESDGGGACSILKGAVNGFKLANWTRTLSL